ncbi:MAG: hypothetical protein QOF73_3473 [Thermomicrobiales bacterium]|jgi:hypothetical protein|nr:hypothetical protein [Thermomicrobiales bacterium]
MEAPPDAGRQYDDRLCDAAFKLGAGFPSTVVASLDRAVLVYARLHRIVVYDRRTGNERLFPLGYGCELDALRHDDG